MNNGVLFEGFRHARIKQLIAIIGIISVVIALLRLFSYTGDYLLLSHPEVSLISPAIVSNSLPDISGLANSKATENLNDDGDNAPTSDDVEKVDAKVNKVDKVGKVGTQSDLVPFVLSKSVSCVETNMSLLHDNKTNEDSCPNSIDTELLQAAPLFSTGSSFMADNPALRKKAKKAHVSVAQMNLILLNISTMRSKRSMWSSVRDHELHYAKFQIENAPIDRSISEIHASLFRNYSMFKRSYELMESIFKVYIYREGEKPIFHQPHLRGIYASEGWFMKLMERNKRFVVKDPKKAHLFYLPFSSLKLRNASSLTSQNDMQNYVKSYVDVIATKYRLWNRKGGSDHFLVACHDWAPRLTRNVFGNCIRVLCNSNIAGGFKIGKDVSLPVTYIRSAENPIKDLGGNSPSKRPILAFFAGGMHGDVRPKLLHYWQDKEPDMKISGPMPRDVESKAKYRELMKSSKYCICAKGYEVHTPRVVESIYYECVPVIISDNYVPPFFEVLNWETFAVFISEDDIPKLRHILLSIPEDRYTMMQQRVQQVQRYFQWHKIPVKYDLFHMILHSVWFNRVFQ